MNRHYVLNALISAAIATSLLSAAPAPKAASNVRLDATENARPVKKYVIGPGDVLQITVYKEPELSVPSTTVRSDGMISVPLVKEVEAGGLTPGELGVLLTQKLSKLVRDADVTVVVKEIHSEQVFVIGAVKKEGGVNLTSRLTVLQAISAAGGFTDYAKRKKVYVLRNDGRKQSRIAFNYEAVLEGANIEQNILLQPGDTIVVPQ